MTRLSLETSHGHYGQIVLEIEDQALFGPYEPFLANFAGSLALLLETRRQRIQLEEAFERLSEEERRYRRLFTEMTTGHAVHEIILDETGLPCDYRFLEVNPAFERITGLKAEVVVGSMVSDILPGLEIPWAENYERAALTGEPVHFEDYNQDLDHYYDVVAYRPQQGQLAVILTDITERRQAEERLHEASKELRAQNKELQKAQGEAARLLAEQRALFQRLQETLLDVPSQLPGVRFAHLYQSATKEAQIGGDFYDVFETKGGRIALLIGDVSGRGIEAAGVATLVKDAVQAFTLRLRRPHLVLRETNRFLVDKDIPGFVTVFLGFLDPGSGTLVYSSAGHPPPLLDTKGRMLVLQSFSPPLGVFGDARYRDSEASMSDGSLLLLYTDGITETRRDGELFGEQRLAESLRRIRHREVESLPGLLLEEALLFTGGGLEDDVALLAVRYLGNGSASTEAV
jgi:PAS domain S-box-containing protein